LLFIINFRVLAKNSKLEIQIYTDKEYNNHKKVIYFEKKKYTKVDLIKKINDQIEIDSKKTDEVLNKEIEKFKNDLKPIEEQISKIKKTLNDVKIEKDEKKLKADKDILDEKKSKIDYEINTRQYIIEWNKDFKINKFEDIDKQYIFSYNYIIHDDEKIGSYNFEPNIDAGIDYSNVVKVKFYYNIKNKRIYDFKFYPFDVRKEDNSYYEKDFSKFGDMSIDELNNNLKKDVDKLNKYLNNRQDFLTYYEIERIIKYLKLQYFSEIFSKKGSFKLFHDGSNIGAIEDFDNEKEGEYGFAYFSYLKPIKIKIKRGDKDDIIECDVHDSDRSIDTTLRRGIQEFYDIKWEDIDKIIKNINGGNYDVKKMQNTIGSKDFFVNNFNLTINSNVKSKQEVAEEAEKERQKQLQEQQKNYYPKPKKENNCFNNCFNNCCCCCGNNSKNNYKN